jgi:hypothetical protein
MGVEIMDDSGRSKHTGLKWTGILFQVSRLTLASAEYNRF